MKNRWCTAWFIYTIDTEAILQHEISIKCQFTINEFKVDIVLFKSSNLSDSRLKKRQIVLIR